MSFNNYMLLIIICIALIVTTFLLVGREDKIKYSYDRSKEIYKEVYNGNLEPVEIICNIGIDPDDMVGPYGMNLLHSAAAGGHDNVVELLLKCGNDINVQDRWKQTALHKAARNGHLNAVKALLKYNPEKDITDIEYFTPSDLAEEKYKEMVDSGDDQAAERYKLIISLIK